MTIRVTKTELEELVKPLVPANVTLTFDKLVAVYVEKGSATAYVSADLRIMDDGTLEIDISRASVAGFAVFGAIRKFIADLVVDKCKDKPGFKIWKNQLGNLQLQVYGVWFYSVKTENGVLEVVSGFSPNKVE